MAINPNQFVPDVPFGGPGNIPGQGYAQVNTNTSMFGGVAAEAASHAGEKLSAAGDKLMDLAAENSANDAFTKSTKAMTDEEVRFRGLRGADMTPDALQEHLANIKSISEDNGSDLSPLARRSYQARMSSELRQQMLRSGDWANGEMQRYGISSQSAIVDRKASMGPDILTQKGVDSPEYQDYSKELLDEVVKLNKLQGKSPDEIGNSISQAHYNSTLAASERLRAANDLDGAKNLVDASIGAYHELPDGSRVPLLTPQNRVALENVRGGLIGAIDKRDTDAIAYNMQTNPGAYSDSIGANSTYQQRIQAAKDIVQQIAPDNKAKQEQLYSPALSMINSIASDKDRQYDRSHQQNTDFISNAVAVGHEALLERAQPLSPSVSYALAHVDPSDPHYGAAMGLVHVDGVMSSVRDKPFTESLADLDALSKKSVQDSAGGINVDNADYQHVIKQARIAITNMAVAAQKDGAAFVAQSTPVLDARQKAIQAYEAAKAAPNDPTAQNNANVASLNLANATYLAQKKLGLNSSQVSVIPNADAKELANTLTVNGGGSIKDIESKIASYAGGDKKLTNIAWRDVLNEAKGVNPAVYQFAFSGDAAVRNLAQRALAGGNASASDSIVAVDKQTIDEAINNNPVLRKLNNGMKDGGAGQMAAALTSDSVKEMAYAYRADNPRISPRQAADAVANMIAKQHALVGVGGNIRIESGDRTRMQFNSDAFCDPQNKTAMETQLSQRFSTLRPDDIVLPRSTGSVVLDRQMKEHLFSSMSIRNLQNYDDGDAWVITHDNGSPVKFTNGPVIIYGPKQSHN